jgi:outer membrane protein insertion porin family
MMLRFIALLGLLAAAPGFAQTAAPKTGRKAAARKPEAAQWPIQSLSVEGNKNFTSQQILAVAGLKVGQLAGKAEFDAARDRLVATGCFETVGYKFAPSKDSSGYTASFQVAEVSPLYAVQFEGLPAKPAEIAEYLQSKDPMFAPKLPPTAELLTRYTRLVQDFLDSRNQSEKVLGKLMPIGVNDFAIVFRSARALPTIAQVKFTGNQALPTTLLQNKLAEVAFGFPYTEAGFRTLLDNAIRPLYDARGRVRVTFPKITTERAIDVNGLAITVTVDEGPEFKLGEVKFAGNYAAKSAELLKIGKFQTGEVANFEGVYQGVDRIKKRMQRLGYLRADTNIERAIHDKTKMVDLTVRIDEGPQFSFGKLTVEGLDLNGEAAIKKLWGLQPGKPFDADYPDFFLNRVREEGLFENLHKTKAVTKMDEQNHLVDVTLQFG